MASFSLVKNKKYEIMKTHTTVGKEVFSKLRNTLRIFDPSYFKVAEEIVAYHHEKWDGSGYPMGLTGNEIPLAARIVAIADVFDALTSKRVYKKAFSFEESLQIIIQDKGKHFDPLVVDTFIDNIHAIRRIYEDAHKKVITIEVLANKHFKRGEVHHG